jgi:hypothetical protein
MSRGLENQLFQLKFAAKQLARESKRCEKNIGVNKTKCKKVCNCLCNHARF